MSLIKLFFALFVLGVLFSFVPSSPHQLLSGSGAVAGRTGSPGDNFQTCKTCHSGPAAIVKTGWITSDIPTSGYVPGTTYNITATVSLNSGNKFGFEISPQNLTGAQIGTLVNTGTQTKLVSGTKYITHTSTGTSANNGTKTWNFQWTAPATGTGDFTFYGAVLKANGSGSSGDTVYTSTLDVTEQQITAVEMKNELQLKAFPNPTNHNISIEIPDHIYSFQIQLLDLQGKLISESTIEKHNDFFELNTQNLNEGTYILRLISAEKVYSTMINKK